MDAADAANLYKHWHQFTSRKAGESVQDYMRRAVKAEAFDPSGANGLEEGELECCISDSALARCDRTVRDAADMWGVSVEEAFYRIEREMHR